MARVKVVTGFIPIANPRSAATYWELGARLLGGLTGPVVARFPNIEDTWLYRWLKNSGRLEHVNHSVQDNPTKNTLEYHCVQHEKFQWLAEAHASDISGADLLVWIDYGILHVPGVTTQIIKDYLARLTDTGEIMIPGCWDKNREISSDFPCWRFCGGLMVVPTKLAPHLLEAVKYTAQDHITLTGNVEWEVNTLARVELDNPKAFHWYEADHNETMFTGLPQ